MVTAGNWSESAYYWEKHREKIRQMFAPITAAMFQALPIERERLILDVAGGTGEPSITLAQQYPGVFFCSTDSAKQMNQAAMQYAARLNLRNIAFATCKAESLSFHDNSFDRTICRLGSMFFDPPLQGMRELLRVTRPGGSIALAVWHAPSSNPMFDDVLQVVQRYLTLPPEDPQAPGAFRFAPEGSLSALLKEAGANAVQERTVSFVIEAPVKLDDFWTLRSEMSDALRPKIRTLPQDQQLKLATEVKDAVRGFFSTGSMRFPARINVVTAKRGE